MMNNWDTPLRKINSHLETRFRRNRWEEDGTVLQQPFWINHLKDSRAESNNFYEYFSAYLNKMQHVHPYVCIVYVTVYGVLHYLAASRIAVSIHHPAAAIMSKEYEIFERWSCKNHASRKLQSLNSDFEKKNRRRQPIDEVLRLFRRRMTLFWITSLITVILWSRSYSPCQIAAAYP